MKGERFDVARLNEPLPPAVAILRRDRYNWAPRGRRLGHRGRVRRAPEGRSVVVCIRDGDRYRRRGREPRVRVDLLGDDLATNAVYFTLAQSCNFLGEGEATISIWLSDRKYEIIIDTVINDRMHFISDYALYILYSRSIPIDFESLLDGEFIPPFRRRGLIPFIQRRL